MILRHKESNIQALLAHLLLLLLLDRIAEDTLFSMIFDYFEQIARLSSITTVPLRRLLFYIQLEFPWF